MVSLSRDNKFISGSPNHAITRFQLSIISEISGKVFPVLIRVYPWFELLELLPEIRHLLLQLSHFIPQRCYLFFELNQPLGIGRSRA